MDFTYFEHDGTGRLTLIFADLSEEDALTLIARVRGLCPGGDRGGEREGVGGGGALGQDEVPATPVSSAQAASGEQPAVRTRKPRAKRGAVADAQVSEEPGSATEHPGDTGHLGPVVEEAKSKDPWGLVPPGQDPDAYRGADGDAAVGSDTGKPVPVGAGEGVHITGNVEQPSSWTREMIESKGRLRDIVQYLYLCDVVTPDAQANILNTLRDDIGILGRIPEKDMKDRIVIIMESLGILPESK